jgi:Cu(I)/Ag(I) efflux system periplasmic protein CusF
VNHFCRAFACGAAVLTLGWFAAAVAQTAPAPAMPKGMAMPAAPAADVVDGEVRNVDKGAGTITLKHGDIKNLNMSGMTMVFRAKDPAMLATVKTGDKVKFKAAMAGDVLLVTELQVVKK